MRPPWVLVGNMGAAWIKKKKGSIFFEFSFVMDGPRV